MVAQCLNGVASIATISRTRLNSEPELGVIECKMTKDAGSSTQSSLVERVKSWEDQDSWETFSRIYRSMIHNFSIRSGLNQDEAEEVSQETLIEVARRLKDREYDRDQGTFRGWLYRLTRWRISNQFKKRQQSWLSLEQAEASDLSIPSSEILVDEASQSWDEDWRQAMLDAAMARLQKCIKPRHHQVLHALVCHGWSPAQVAKILRMSRGQVYLIKLRGIVLLKKQIALLEKEQIP